MESTPNSTSPPPPLSPKLPSAGRTARWILLGCALVLAAVIGLAAWLIGLPSLIRSQIAIHRAQQAEQANDWPKALTLWGAAMNARPLDRDLVFWHRNAQVELLLHVHSEIAPLSPAERFLYFRDPGRTATRQLLTEPHASAHEAFIQQNAALVFEAMRQQFDTALETLEGGDFAAARKLMADLARTASAAEDFDAWQKTFGAAEVAARVAGVTAAAEAGELARARGILTELLAQAQLPDAEADSLAFMIEFNGYVQSLGQAIASARDGDDPAAMQSLAAGSRAAAELLSHPGHAAFFAELPEPERGTAVLQYLNEATQHVRQVAGERTVRRLFPLLISDDIAAAQKVLDGATAALDWFPRATAAELRAEKSATRLLAWLEQAHAGSGGIALLEHARAKLDDPEAVRKHLVETYELWTGSVFEEGNYGLALYLADLAAAEGADFSPEARQKLLELCAEQLAVRVIVSPAKETRETRAAALMPVAPLLEALAATLRNERYWWLRTETSETAGDDGHEINIRLSLSTPKQEGDQYTYTLPDGGGGYGHIGISIFRLNYATEGKAGFHVGGKKVSDTQWPANLRYAALQTAGEVGLLNLFPHTPQPRFLHVTSVSRQLTADLAAKIQAQTYRWHHRLAEATFARITDLGEELSADQRAGLCWAQTALWASSGLKVADRDRHEAALRQMVGLPALAVKPPVPAKAQPARGEPFVNSLGMPLLQLPRSGTLVAVHETRVKDYARFSEATGRAVPHYDPRTAAANTELGLNYDGHSWKHPNFEQSEDHPVVRLTREDMEAFCMWLTERDRTAGLIAPTQSYRLPADLEWSEAAGLIEDPNLTIAERSARPSEFPWGSAWPIPPGAGNFGGYEAIDSSAWMQFRPLEGWSDGYARTAPVGSFSANPLGFHDLAGNVQELILEPMVINGSTMQTARPSCFFTNSPKALKISARADVPNLGSMILGFRIALAEER